MCSLGFNIIVFVGLSIWLLLLVVCYVRGVLVLVCLYGVVCVFVHWCGSDVNISIMVG